MIYCDITSEPPTRYEMIKYSTWRIYLYNELEGESFDRRDKKIFENYCTRFKNLSVSEERKNFYNFLHTPSGESSRNDNISHFICRMLYCQEETTHQTFVALEKRILEERLLRMFFDKSQTQRADVMSLMKKMLAIFKGKEFGCYDITQDQWNLYKDKIVFSLQYGKDRREEYAKLYARLPFMEADLGIRKRKSFVYKG